MYKKLSIFKQNYLVLILLILLVGIPSYVIYHYRVMSPTNNDYETHLQVVQTYLTYEPVPKSSLSHPILQLALIGISWITRGVIDFQEGLVLLLTGSNVLLAISIYLWFGDHKKPGRDWARMFWAATLTFAAPIMILAAVDERFYFGYIGLANYHNPTIQLLRPFAVVLFILSLRVFNHKKNPTWLIVFAALLTIFTALIKPNLTTCLIPALIVLSIIFVYKKEKMDWKLWAFGFILPALMILLWQYRITYSEAIDANKGIIFAPFVIDRNVSNYLLLKFFLSIFFPLVVLLIHNKFLKHENALKLSWLTFLAGTAQAYLFAEGGSDFKAGNFRWGAQIGLLLLFIASARLIFQQHANWSMKERTINYLAYLPHVAGGIVYFLYCLLTIYYE